MTDLGPSGKPIFIQAHVMATFHYYTFSPVNKGRQGRVSVFILLSLLESSIGRRFYKEFYVSANLSRFLATDCPDLNTQDVI
jgi:hypothetical protein